MNQITIKSSIYFTYNGISSEIYDLKNVTLSTGMQSEPFLPTTNVKTLKVRGRDKPYLQDVEREVLRLTLTFSFGENQWDEERIRTVARWFWTDKYLPLWFSERPNLIYYAMYTGTFELLHNSLKQGVVNLEMICNAPYAFSPVNEDIFDLSENGAEGTAVQVDNIGDLPIKPELFIYMYEAGNVSIVNQSNNDEELTLTGLAMEETVYLDCENEDIISDIDMTFRYDEHNNIFLTLPIGTNNLLVTGKVELKVRFQAIMLQG